MMVSFILGMLERAFWHEFSSTSCLYLKEESISRQILCER